MNQTVFSTEEHDLTGDDAVGIVEAAGFGVIWLDDVGKVLHASPLAEIMFGYPKASLSGYSCQNLTRAGSILENTGDFIAVRQDGTAFPIEVKHWQTASDRATTVCVIRDTSDVAAAIRNIKNALHAVPSALASVNQHGRITFVNTALQNLFGYTERELLDKPVEVLIPQHLRDGHHEVRQGFEKAPTKRQMGEGSDLFGLRKDGVQIPVKIGLNPIDTASGPAVIAAIVDMTEHRRAQKNIWTTFNAAPNALVMTDADGLMSIVNDALLHMFGYRRDELLGHHIESLVPFDFAEHVPSLTEDSLSEVTGSDLRGKRKDGSSLPVELGLRLINGPDGSAIIASIVDVTERRKSQEIIQRQLEELQRSNHDLEEFAYVASHDLQEPLRMVASYTQLLERRYGEHLDDDARDFIGYAVDGAKRMQTLIQDLLEYSRLGTRAALTETVNMESLYAGVVHDLTFLIEETGSTITRGDLPPVDGDPGQLSEVLQNLISNAIKYRSPDRVNRIHVSAQKTGEHFEFCVADNGIGIEPAYFSRIFVIFKRLHSGGTYAGTGIGLSIVKRIVEMRGGEVWLESTPGEGSRFFFTLPAEVCSQNAEEE